MGILWHFMAFDYGLLFWIMYVLACLRSSLKWGDLLCSQTHDIISFSIPAEECCCLWWYNLSLTYNKTEIDSHKKLWNLSQYVIKWKLTS